MISWILISLLCLFLIWILVAPVIIYASTDRKRVSVSLPGIFQAAVVPSEGLFMVRGWILFIPYNFNPFRERKRKARKKKIKKRKKNILRRSPVKARMVRPMLRAIRIRKLRLNLDTDDFALNAWLIPAFSYVNSDNIQMRVNFQGDFSLLMDVRTRIGSLLWVFIRSKI